MQVFDMYHPPSNTRPFNMCGFNPRFCFSFSEKVALDEQRKQFTLSLTQANAALSGPTSYAFSIPNCKI